MWFFFFLAVSRCNDVASLLVLFVCRILYIQVQPHYLKNPSFSWTDNLFGQLVWVRTAVATGQAEQRPLPFPQQPCQLFVGNERSVWRCCCPSLSRGSLRSLLKTVMRGATPKGRVLTMCLQWFFNVEELWQLGFKVFQGTLRKYTVV